MPTDCEKWTRGCEECQRNKLPQSKSHGLIELIVSDGPFDIGNIDIKGPYKMSRGGYRFTFVFVCHYTSWPEAMPLRGISAAEVSSAFYKLVISRHGCPRKIITDKGSQFVGHIFRHICKFFNIEFQPTTAAHQQANGKAEKFINFLNDNIAIKAKKDQSNWDEVIDHVLMTYRTTVSRSLNETAFFLLIFYA